MNNLNFPKIRSVAVTALLAVLLGHLAISATIAISSHHANPYVTDFTSQAVGPSGYEQNTRHISTMYSLVTSDSSGARYTFHPTVDIVAIPSRQLQQRPDSSSTTLQPTQNPVIVHITPSPKPFTNTIHISAAIIAVILIAIAVAAQVAILCASQTFSGQSRPTAAETVCP